MSLGVITLAAGSELVLNQLRLNARAILVLTLSLCVSALVLVSSAMAVLLSYHDAVLGRRPPPTKTIAVISGVIAIARSPRLGDRDSDRCSAPTGRSRRRCSARRWSPTSSSSSSLIVVSRLCRGARRRARPPAPARHRPLVRLAPRALARPWRRPRRFGSSAILARAARARAVLRGRAPARDGPRAEPSDGGTRGTSCAYAFAARASRRSILHARPTAGGAPLG